MQDDVASNSTVSGYVPLYNPVPIYNEDNGTTPVSTAPVCLEYKVSVDSGFKQIVDSGKAYTSSDVDYTLKVLSLPSLVPEFDLTEYAGRGPKANPVHPLLLPIQCV